MGSQFAAPFLFGNHTYYSRIFSIYNFYKKRMGGFRMTTDINKICYTMNLTPYQTQTITSGAGKYDVNGLVKRGGVLYAPHAANGFIRGISRLLFGKTADLIGPDKTMLRAVRGLKFCAGGFHCITVGRNKYYADASGRAISRDAFRRAIKDESR